MHDVNQIVKASTGELALLLVENKTSKCCSAIENITQLIYSDNKIIYNNYHKFSLILEFQNIRELVEIDSIYLRSLIEQKSSTSRDMSLQEGSLLRVVNTCSLPNYWVAWLIDEATGNDIQLKRILPPLV